MSESLYLTQTNWTMENENFIYDYDVKEIPLYENQKGYWGDLELVESIWKIKPDIESPEILAKRQYLPWSMIQLPVHLTTNQMMFWAVEFLRLHPWASFLHWRNEESISNKENQIKLTPLLILFVVCACDIPWWSWFYKKRLLYNCILWSFKLFELSNSSKKSASYYS